MNFFEILQSLKSELTCALVLAVLLYKSANSIYKRRSWGLFTGVVFVCLIFTVSSAASILIDHGMYKVPASVNYGFNLLYFFSLDISCYLWFLFSEYSQESRLVKDKGLKLLNPLPFVLLLALTVLSCWTHGVFYVDENGCYQRGPLFVLQFVVPYSYILFTSIKAFYKSCLKENYLKRDEYRTIAKFMLAPLFFSSFQLFLPEALTLSMGMTLATLLVYLDSQETLISLDPLTRLNNRSQLIWYLSQKMKNRSEGRQLYLLMMDMDEFKQINDRFGHVEGDEALVQIADVLKRAAAGRDCFIARYGGDEFIVVCETSSPGELEDFCRAIREGLAAENAKPDAGFRLSLSIGCAVCTEETASIPDFIKAADKDLYRVKKSKGGVMR